MTKRILISGAGVAGPVLAFWLTHYGFSVTMIERAPQLRTVGQTVDIRGWGLEVIRKMGLEEEIRRRATHEEGLYFMNSDNVPQVITGTPTLHVQYAPNTNYTFIPRAFTRTCTRACGVRVRVVCEHAGASVNSF